jgi:hypothetical protein
MIFYKGKPFDPKAAILSDLQSPDENPHGYGVAALGTALFAILLAPATPVFYHSLQKEHPKLSLAGAIAFAVGLTSGVSIGILAPFTHGYTPLHVQLASGPSSASAPGLGSTCSRPGPFRLCLFFSLRRC